MENEIKNDTKKFTKEEAIAVLRAEQEDNQKKCMEEIHAVLNKYGMNLRIVQNVALEPAAR